MEPTAATLFFLWLSFSLLHLISCGTTTTVVTVTAAAAAPSASSSSSSDSSPQYTSDAAFRSAILNSTNTYRAAYNASAVSWNLTLAAYAAAYVGGTCDFAHSGGPYGENLAEGYLDAAAAVDAWGNEAGKYRWSSPGFAEATGHFTQLVWKATTDVGCGRRDCGDGGGGGGGGGGWYVVCEYWPPGNVVGEFRQEVDREVSMGAPRSGRQPGGWLWAAAIGLLALWVLI
ncbi:CAP domain-containing protein [Xylariaceae sp. FL0804]|nr:CAP domain-containing protein [Xylariaceae sp. FL0804]